MKSTYGYRILSLFTLIAVQGRSADVRRLTLTEAVHLAIAQNRSLKIARLKVMENERKKDAERAGYFPALTNESNLLRITELQNVEIPAGVFGTIGETPIPARSLIIPQGRLTFYSSGTMLAQPLTQLVRIRQSNRIAAAEVAVSREDLRKAENQVALRVHSLYFNILITRLQKQAAEQQITYATENLRESEEDIRNGSALKVAAIQGLAGLLESQQDVLTAELQVEDLTSELNDLLALPMDTRLELDPSVPASVELRPREEYLRAAWSESPEIQAAVETVRKAEAGVTAAKSAYIPDITAYARHSYQVGVPFLVHNFGTFGFHMEWTVFEFGKRRAVIRERELQLAQAEENLRRIREEIGVQVESGYHKLERTRTLVQVASQVVKLRQESERLAQNELAQGVVLVSAREQATAASYKARAELLRASLGYLLAWAELEQTVGRTPGL
jgi:outer membrane protein